MSLKIGVAKMSARAKTPHDDFERLLESCVEMLTQMRQKPTIPTILASMLLFLVAAILPAAAQAQTSAYSLPQAPATGVSYRLQVAREGIYRLTYNDLQSAGLPVSTLNPLQLQMFVGGSEIAIYVAGEADGHLDPGDYVLFYGQPVHTLYTLSLIHISEPTRPY